MPTREQLISLVLAFACGLAHASAEDRNPLTVRTIPRPQSQPLAPDLVIQTKTVPAHDVFYLEHQGPYWRLGPLFRQIEHARRQLGINAPMYARFCAPPLDPRAAACTTEVGLITEEPASPGPAFRTAHRDAELVAFATIRSHVSSTRQHYDPLFKWVKENGFTPTGPVTEVHLPPAKDQPISGPRTELRVAITVEAQPTSDAARPIKIEGPKPRVAEAPASGPAVNAVEAPSGETKAEPTGDGGATASPPDTGLDSASADQPGPGTESRPGETEARPELFRPIPELVKEQDWDRIARQLMPDDLNIPVSTQVWFGHVVFRIGALGKGLDQQASGPRPAPAQLAEAVSKRYRLVSSGFAMDPLSQAVVRIDRRDDPNADVKRKILRELDTLLARAAQRSLDSHKALDELSRILERTYDLVHETTP